MQEEDWGAFRALMAQAAELTVMPGGKDLGRVTAALFDALAAYPLEAVAEAVGGYCRSERFFPMLSDIVARIEGRASERAALAWAEVLKAVRRWGRYESVRFPRPATHWAIQQMGGWPHLAASLTLDDERFVARDFERLYILGERAVAGGAPVADHLAGLHEIMDPSRPRRPVELGSGAPGGLALT